MPISKNSQSVYKSRLIKLGRRLMKIKYILWVICALLLLNTSVILAQEIGGTNTTGKVGFLEKNQLKNHQ